MLRLSALLTTGRRRILTTPSSLSLHQRLFSTQSPPSIEYTLSHPIYMIWGANTGLGKTLVSAGLASSFLLSPLSKKFIYLKPVQTGFPTDSDSLLVYRKFSQFFHHRKPSFTVLASNHVLRTSIAAAGGVLGVETGEGVELESGVRDLGWYEERRLQGEEAGEAEAVKELICKTMYGWREAVSAHLAAEREGAVVEDSVVLEMLKRGLGIGLEGGRFEGGGEKVGVLSVVETAGGVASPGPSGSLQCDLYRFVISLLHSTLSIPIRLSNSGKITFITPTDAQLSSSHPSAF